MSLKVVLPLATLVFGGSATVTTGVYFYSHGSGTGKGPGGDPKGPATTPPKGGQEKQKDDQSGETMKKETSDQLPDPSAKGHDENKGRSNGAEGEEPLRAADTNENPQGPKPPEDSGSNGAPSPDQNKPTGTETSSTPDNKEKLSDRQPGTEVPSEGDSPTNEGEKEGKQDSVESPADNTQRDGNSDSKRSAAPGGEGNTEPKQENTKSPDGQGNGEVTEGAGNAPTQPQEDSAERSEDDGKANPKSKGADETVETAGGNKQNVSDVSDTNSQESSSREGSLSSEKSQ